ncbi:MAG TPA: 1-acyl-sn-glycerol-3-phosphate acyltransferase [Dermatophilaceae bacterium]|nr:1-acyl-sn-glycerol-3-phosphate acyltransferase [Dermatophilaceae bacterium]
MNEQPDGGRVVPLRGPGRDRSAAALAAGTARAGGERARRQRTPLLPEPVTPPVTAQPAPRTSVHRPQPKVARPSPARLPAASGSRSRSDGPSQARPDPGWAARTPARAVHAVPAAPATTSPVGPRPGLEELVAVAVSLMRAAARAGGLSGDEVERQVAHTLAFLRRRLRGDYTVDEYGFDEEFTEHAYLPLLRPLYKRWFRVEVRGIEHIPAEGGALVVANHSGTLALDSLMTQVAVHDEHPANRHLRMLAADLVFRTPVVGEIARKSGSTLAANADAERLLAAGELAGVWPEGFKGVGKPFSERYKLQRFGRGGFVAAALRTGVPIVPCSIVGAEEIYPMLGNLKPVARLVGAPYLPVTPTFPLLGPLGLIPLPSKWIIEFGSPVDTSVLGSTAADDPMVVFDLTDRIRETIQQTLYALLMQRRSVFF